jgi:CheY-like chemotaxis protein
MIWEAEILASLLRQRFPSADLFPMLPAYILFVDDEVFLLRLILARLQREGLRLFPKEVVSSAKAAWQMISARKARFGEAPAAIVSDYHMPTTTGEMFLQEAAVRFPHTPLYLFTSGAEPGVCERLALLPNFRGCLDKTEVYKLRIHLDSVIRKAAA